MNSHIKCEINLIQNYLETFNMHPLKMNLGRCFSGMVFKSFVFCRNKTKLLKRAAAQKPTTKLG